MKKLCLLLFLLGSFWASQAQESEPTTLLRIILEKYYKNEKPVVKNRSQLLYLYCTQANNTGELIEATQKTSLPKDFVQEIRNKINTDLAERFWTSELDAIFANDPAKIKSKVKECVSLDQYQEISKRLNLNNQRLLIVGKPLIYSKGNLALVKVVFYRNIEHNSSTVLLFEKIDGVWTVKQNLNSWST
ncbi:MAG: hypothetical protein U0X58_10290 [Flavobacteriaceae bacterium]